jgi:cytochrome c-type biogenesis protein CcmH
MNTSLIMALLVISFVGLLLFWLFYRKSNSTQKLAENHLIEQLKNQDLSAEQRSAFEKQLSKILLHGHQSNGSLKIVALVAVFVLPFSFYFYNALGNPKALDYVPQSAQNKTTGNQQEQAPQMSMEDAIAQLEERLKNNPDDVDGQMLYARSQISLKNYDKAVAAYRKSNDLAPNESVILTELAEAIALANDKRSFLGEPEALLAKAVDLEPNNQKALWLLGMTYYEHKDFVKTNDIWSKLYVMMEDEGAKKQLAQQLNGIRSKLGEQAIDSSSTDNKPKKPTTTQLSLQVTITDDLKSKLKVKPALLYIYTKEPTGMPMPIAVIKQSLESIDKTFPLAFTMSDANSLQPNRLLNDFNQIKIGARISFSGNAMPQSGDFQSDELVIDLPYTETIELNINKLRD